MTSLQDLMNLVHRYRWYHSIPLADGLLTPGKRSHEHLSEKLAVMHLPDDLTGRSLLDIGCNEGFYTIEACQARSFSRCWGWIASSGRMSPPSSPL